MNPTMGTYIADLDSEGRDRLISAPEFSDGQWWENECGCLVGTAMHWPALTADAQYHTEQEAREANVVANRTAMAHRRHRVWQAKPPAYRYPKAIERFGKKRVVRAIKLRAAKLNGTSPEAIAHLLEQRQEISA